MTQPIVLKGEYSEAENSDCAKTCAISDISSLAPVDRQDLQTIISLWPELSPETKANIMGIIKAQTLTSAN